MDKNYEVYNPTNKPVDELPTIFGFNNGGGNMFLHAQLIAEDGTALGSHACSNEAYMIGDLGIAKGSRADRHETFRKHYPDGYKMDFVSGSDVKEHKGLMKAFELNQKLRPQSEGNNAEVKIETT